MNSRQLYDYLFKPTLLKLTDLARRDGDVEEVNFCVVKRPGHPTSPFEVLQEGAIAFGLESDTEWTGLVSVRLDTNKLHQSRYLIEQTKFLLLKLTQRDFVPFWNKGVIK